MAFTVASPVEPEVTGPRAFTVREGDTVVATLSATDADTDAADLTWSIPAGAAGGADRDRFTLTPAGVLSLSQGKDFELPDDADGDGSYRVTVQVSDGALTATADVTVVLANINEPPTANAGQDQSVDAGTSVTLHGSGSDQDAGDTLTYIWTQTGGTVVALSDAAASSLTFTAPDEVSGAIALTFTLRITDAGGLHDEDAVTVTVHEVVPPEATVPPVATVTADTGAVTEGAAVTFTVSLDAAAAEAVSVGFAASETRAMLSHALPTAVAFAVGDRTRTVTLPTSDDAVIESPSVVTLTLSAGAGYTLGSPASADAEVSDNDAATFSVTATAAQIHEGRSASVTVAIANGTTFAEVQSIALSVSGSATAADYRAVADQP